jgi:hypothetical protein
MYIAGVVASLLTAGIHFYAENTKTGLGWLTLAGIWGLSGYLRSRQEGGKE